MPKTCHYDRLSWIEDCYSRGWFPWHHYWRCILGFWKCQTCFYAKLTVFVTKSL